MSDAIIQKQRLTAYQRWELPAFDMAEVASEPAPAVTVAQLEQIQQQAHEEGYKAGHAEGHAEGYAKGYAEGAQKAHDEAQRMAEIAGALEKELHRVDEQVAQNLLDLALEIARQMLQQTLKVKPDLLLNVVRNAISNMPHFNQHAHLILHPADAELVRSSMGEQLNHTGWKILEDAQMGRGGCRVETAHSQIDATLATRWKRVVSSIGQDSTWLES